MAGIELSTVYVNIAARLGPLMAGLGRARAALSAFGSQMMAQGRSMLMIGAMLSAPFILSTKAAMNFEDQMSKVATMLDATTMHMLPDMGDAVKQLAVDYGMSTKVITDGLYAVLSAQIPAAQAMEFMRVASEAAVGGITDVNTAVLALTKVMAAYQMGVEQATDASDFLFTIVRQGQLTFGDLASAIPMVTGIAAQAGLRMEELGAAVATTSKFLGNARRATFALSAMLSVFLKSTTEAKWVAFRYGVALNSATLQTEGLWGVLQKLRRAPPEALAQIFPRRGLRGILALLQGIEKYGEDLIAMYQRQGAAAEAFSKRAETASFKWKQTKQIISVLAMEIGNALLPAILTLSFFVKDNFEAMRNWIKEHQRAIKIMAAVAIGIFALGAAMLAIGIVAKTLAMVFVVGPFAIIAAGVAMAIDAFTDMDTGFTKVIENIKIAGISLKDWATIVVLEFWKKWELFTTEIADLWDSSITMMKMIGQTFWTGMLKGIAMFKKAWAITVEFFESTWDKITTAAKKANIKLMISDPGDQQAAMAQLDREAASRAQKRTANLQKNLADYNADIANADATLREALGAGQAEFQARSKARFEEAKKDVEMLGEAQDEVARRSAEEAEDAAEEETEGWMDKLKAKLEAAKQAMRDLMAGLGMKGEIGGMQQATQTLFTSPFMRGPTPGAFATAAARDPQLDELKRQTSLLAQIEDELPGAAQFGPG